MEILSLTDSNTQDLCQKAASVLDTGGIVLYPTDTLYGLAVDATSEQAVQKLRALKDRDEENKFSICVADTSMLSRYATLTPLATELTLKYLPGALTLIVPMKIPLTTNTSKDGTLAIRIPNQLFCLELGKLFGKPYTATSANVSGKETLSSPTAILEQFSDRAHLIDLVIDAGVLSGSTGSTVVDATGDLPKILRQGPLYIT